jgi:hypothetical protein
MTDRAAFEAWYAGIEIYTGMDRESTAWLAWGAAIITERERTQALTNAAEQFVAWHADRDEVTEGMLGYFEDIFSDALPAAAALGRGDGG